MRLTNFFSSMQLALIASSLISEASSLTLKERYLQFGLLDNTETEGALIDIYQATNGINWNNNDLWMEDDCFCIWHGILCEGNRLDKILLSDNNLVGSLPSASFSIFMTIAALDLSGNNISGPIPTEIFNIFNLELLDLSGNHFSGTIPTEIGNLENLKEIKFSGNKLTGTIPTNIGSISRLKTLDFSDNDFSGTIPTEIGNLNNLNELDLSKNKLSGFIPTTIGFIKTLKSFEIHQNANLTGGMPTEICTLYNNWVANSGNLASIVGDCTIGECDALGIGQSFPCPCTCCAVEQSPCCYSDSSSNCTDF